MSAENLPSENQTSPMKIESSIQTKLAEALNPTLLDVVNESSGHRVPPGSETHFKAIVVSSAFEGKSRVQRHQMIYQLLGEERDQGLHALALWTYTSSEWEALPEGHHTLSPKCRHK